MINIDKENERLEVVLKLIENHTSEEIDTILNSTNDYTLNKYLSSSRSNILSVCDINPDDTCLEIGSSCGEITSKLASMAKHVDCIEISKIKNSIHKKINIANNISIYDKDLKQNKLKKVYNKIFLIDTLYYANKYLPKSKNSCLDLLIEAKKLLKENGVLYIGVDNKYAMKYFSGVNEEISDELFSSINGQITKFSNNDLKRLIKDAGFKNYYFYYPLPDHRFAKEIYSEDFLPQNNSLHNINHNVTERYVFFNEEKAINEAINSDHFETFSNSFLIKCW